MKKFVFRFQALLDTKKHFEELYENELAVLMRQQQEEETLLEDIKQRLRRYQREYVGHTTATVEEIRRYRDYFDKLNNDIELQKERIGAAIEAVETKRQELIAVQKERLALEKLKEKDYREYQHELMMWERKFLDEIGTGAYIRRGGEERIH